MSTVSIGTGTGVLLTAIVGLAAILIALRLGLLPPLAGFLLFMAVWTGGALTGLGFGLSALRSADTRPDAWPAILIALIALSPVLLMLPALRSPRIHDITTSPEDPPAFDAALEAPQNRGRDMSYPDGGEEVPELQRRGYPDVGPVTLELAPRDALQRSLAVARELGWQIVDVNAEDGRIEATATSALFRFVDDIVIRVRAEGAGSRVDLRSTSRVGQGDLGANAARIRAFTARIVND
jgi:uncharacterized protein (DUF1499 family)